MSIGMPYDLYWNGPPEATKAFRKAYELREQRRNQELWLQGRYIYDALLAVSPMFRTNFKGGRIQPEPYTKEPYPVTEADRRRLEKEKQKREEELLKAQFDAFIKNLRINKEGNNGNNP